MTQMTQENMDQYRTLNNNTVIGNKIPKKNSNTTNSRNTNLTAAGDDLQHMMYNTVDGAIGHNQISHEMLP